MDASKNTQMKQNLKSLEDSQKHATVMMDRTQSVNVQIASNHAKLREQVTQLFVEIQETLTAEKEEIIVFIDKEEEACLTHVKSYISEVEKKRDDLDSLGLAAKDKPDKELTDHFEWSLEKMLTTGIKVHQCCLEMLELEVALIDQLKQDLQVAVRNLGKVICSKVRQKKHPPSESGWTAALKSNKHITTEPSCVPQMPALTLDVNTVYRSIYVSDGRLWEGQDLQVARRNLDPVTCSKVRQKKNTQSESEWTPSPKLDDHITTEHCIPQMPARTLDVNPAHHNIYISDDGLSEGQDLQVAAGNLGKVICSKVTQKNTENTVVNNYITIEPSCVPQMPALTLDVNTAHRNIYVSNDGLSARWTPQVQARLPHPNRFRLNPQILCSQGFSSGRHSWHVELGGTRRWEVGVTCKSRDHSWVDSCIMWALRWDGRQLQAFEGQKRYFSPKLSSIQQAPALIRVHLDCSQNMLSFCSVEGTSGEHTLHSFNIKPSGPLYPGFYLEESFLKITNYLSY